MYIYNNNNNNNNNDNNNNNTERRVFYTLSATRNIYSLTFLKIQKLSKISKVVLPPNHAKFSPTNKKKYRTGSTDPHRIFSRRFLRKEKNTEQVLWTTLRTFSRRFLRKKK